MRIIFSAVAVSIKLPRYKLNPFAIFFMVHDLIFDKLSKLVKRLPNYAVVLLMLDLDFLNE